MDIQERFQKNLRRWLVFDRSKVETLNNLNCVETSLVQNANNTPNIKIQMGDSFLYLHSEEDPQVEAQEWFSKLTLKDEEILFVYGVGLGYGYEAAKEWLHAFEGRKIVFLEPSLEVLKWLFESERGTEILNDKQVWLFHYNPKEALLRNLAINFIMKSHRYTSLPIYEIFFTSDVHAAKVQLEYLMDNRRGLFSEYFNHGRVFLGNYFANLLLLPHAHFGNKLFGQFKDVPAIICGAGPSLAQNIEVLKTLKDRALIFAGATAMNALNAFGLTPHLGVGIDPNPAQFTRLIMNDAFEVPYFYRQRFLNQALKTVHGDHLFLTGTSGYDVGKWMEENLGIVGEDIPEGHNVVNLSTSIATSLGCNPIIFVGLDLAYTEMHSYSPGVLNHPLHNLRDSFRTKSQAEELVPRKDIHGKPIFTLWKWLSESGWYTHFTGKHPNVLFLNATEGGIGMEGVANKPLVEVAEALLQKQYDFEGCLAQALDQAEFPPGLNVEGIFKNLDILYDSLQNCIKQCTLMYDDLEKVLKEVEDDREISPALFSEEGLQALLEFDKEVGYENLLKTFNESFKFVLAHEFTQLDYDLELISEKDYLIRKIGLNRSRYKYLRVTAKSVLGFIDKMRNEETLKKGRELRKNRSENTSKSPSGGVYKFENGILEMSDPELELHIKEPFEPDSKGDAGPYFLKGILHGPSRFYSREGTLLSESWYYHGLKQGKAHIYFASGALKRLQRYKEGKWQGLQETYYADGNLKSTLSYSGGILNGEVLLYYPNGTLKRQLNYLNGKRDGIERLWNEMGLMIIEAEFKMGFPTGTARRWYDNGNMAEEITFNEHNQTPNYKEWEENGTPKPTSSYYKHDYFDKVSLQTGKLTDALENVFTNVAHVAPLIDQTNSPQSVAFNELMHSELAKLEEKVFELRTINQKLLFETGLDPSNPEEAIWKSPETRKRVESQIDNLTSMMCSEMNTIQEALVKAVTLLSQKTKPKILKDNDNAE